MERASRLRNLWNWLVPFRAVAEAEHLPTASNALHVTSSALSRTIKLLEDDVGRPLFEREGGRLVLNGAGREMLVAVREAMRRVDEALVAIDPARAVSPVHVTMSGPFAPILLFPAIEALVCDEPDLVVNLKTVSPLDVNELLRRGQLDVAMVDAPTPTDDLTVEKLVDIPHAVCSGPGHALFDSERADESTLVPHSFVAPSADGHGRIPDEWPLHLPRRVGLWVTQMQVGVEACATGRYLAVLPVPVARRAGLRPLAGVVIPSATLYLVHRPTLEVRGRTERVVDAIRRACEDAALD